MRGIVGRNLKDSNEQQRFKTFLNQRVVDGGERVEKTLEQIHSSWFNSATWTTW